ncbi:YisL family protein [Bacillus sp. FJAT-50079]|uniref:YisL family protein n=1 Tax=Bacillus sp. FJAT-50079 TaxID=2833577 RepID=UPI001BC95D68|nr:YisL family protein [Bacillus sp. FJAT-50079]MBS4210659.1 YisL family protein [Bacillus sp. FJAT-50079]
MFENTHAHISTWVIALILFVVALILHKSGNKKATKIVQMILRLFYLLIMATGIILFVKFSGGDPALYGIKFLGGLVVIAMMEMILVRMGKGKKTGVFWAIFLIALIVTFFLGVKLPLGWWWIK